MYADIGFPMRLEWEKVLYGDDVTTHYISKTKLTRIIWGIPRYSAQCWVNALWSSHGPVIFPRRYRVCIDSRKTIGQNYMPEKPELCHGYIGLV